MRGLNGEFADYFYSLGYDVLVPDNRGHGKSEGDYIGFGWLDRLDYVKWIDQIIEKKAKMRKSYYLVSVWELRQL